MYSNTDKMGKTSHKENKEIFDWNTMKKKKDTVKIKEGIIHATERLQLGFAWKQGYFSFKSPNILNVNIFTS